MQPRLNPWVLFEGFSLLNKPGIRAYVIFPLLANFLAFVALFYSFYRFALYSQGQFIAWLPSWLAFTSYLLWPVIIVLALLCLIYGFTLLGNFIAAPFNAFLSEAVEEHYGFPSNQQAFSAAYLMKVIYMSLWRELRKLLWSIKWWLLAFILSFIPVVNLLSLVIAAWLMAVQYLDYPADNHAVPFKQALRLFKQQGLNSLSFGGLTLLLSGIPLLNIFVMPAAVCAATILWHQQIKVDSHQA